MSAPLTVPTLSVSIDDMAKRRPKVDHPGEVLWRHFMEPHGISKYRLAKELGVSEQHIGRIVLGTRGITGDMALRLAQFFETEPELWLNLQSQYDLDIARRHAGRAIEKQVRPLRDLLSEQE